MSFDISISRRLGERRIAVDFHTGPGVTALFGQSGAGKTSVLNMVAGLLRPDQGQIQVAGHTVFDSMTGIDLSPADRRIGYIFQDARLFPHMRVRANLTYGSHGRTSLITFQAAVEMLGIAALLDRWPATLSGGEAQRVAIGRALLSGPRCLLMDEPLTSLDAPRREEILILIEQVRDQTALPILYISHDRSEVDRLAAHIIAMPL